MQNLLLEQLARMRVLYRSPHSPAELKINADDWAEHLAGENAASIAKAFDEHRATSRFFPVLADIVAILPRVRVAAAGTCTTLPEYTVGSRDRAKAIANTALKALRGDVAAREKMDDLMRATGKRCTA